MGVLFRGQRLLRNPLYPRRSTSSAERTNGASQNEGRSELGGYTMEAMVPAADGAAGGHLALALAGAGLPPARLLLLL